MDITNALTVDVEDYFHVSAFAQNINRSNWHCYPSRVDYNTRRLLDLFDEFQVKATFFVLGWVAEREPLLVKDIDLRGHEVACHGYSHQLVYQQTREVFYRETLHAKSLIQDIIQKPISGYRAASYSITKASKWALDILAELGFKYDSSIFPIRHDRYGIPDAKCIPHTFETEYGKSIVEFPISTTKLFGFNLPVAGGGYFRLYPYIITKAGLMQVNKVNRPFIFYVHPWEIDPDQPRIKSSSISMFRHYNNLDKCESRLKLLMNDFKFTTAINVLSQQKLLVL
jgi:polysaccharide deacetylase family protein (PEP-CTERM system associated)